MAHLLDLTPAFERAAGAPPESGDVSRDPTEGTEAPLNYGDWIVPHVATFSGVSTSFSRTYRPSDEALRHALDNARFMRNDPVIMEPLELRQKAVALLDWHVVAEDERDRDSKVLAEEVERILRNMDGFMQYRECLLHANWFGRYAVMNKWGRAWVGDYNRHIPVDWKPVHGDKLVFRFDDFGPKKPAGQIGIKIGPGMHQSELFQKWDPKQRAKIETTDSGLAYFLDHWERTAIAVHKYMIEDGEWEDPASAGRVHGVGIRSRIYWVWYQKQETLAFLMEYLERSAGGIEIWYYPMGNAQAKLQTESAIKERMSMGRNVVLAPRPAGQDGAHYDITHLEPGMGGIEQLKDVVERYFGHQIKRYILGQTLTTEAEATGLGSGVADAHIETFMLLVRYDATLLEETLTKELVTPLRDFNFPAARRKKLLFRIDTESPDSEKKLAAYADAFGLGLEIDGQDVRDLIGAAKPGPGAEVLSIVALQKAQAAIQSAANPAPAPDGSFDASGLDGAPSGDAEPARMSAEATPVGAALAQAPNPLSSSSDRMPLLPSDAPR